MGNAELAERPQPQPVRGKRQVLVWFETNVQPHFPLVGARLQTGQVDIDFEQLGLLRLVRERPDRLASEQRTGAAALPGPGAGDAAARRVHARAGRARVRAPRLSCELRLTFEG